MDSSTGVGRRRIMKSVVVGLLLLGLAGISRAADEPARRIALEGWQMAGMRVGHIVESEFTLKNESKELLQNINVTIDFFGPNAKNLGRTTETAMDMTGNPAKGRQGYVDKLAAGGKAPLVVRAKKIPAFVTYLVTVKYSAAAKSCTEEFEGTAGNAPERKGAAPPRPDQPRPDQPLGNKLELKIIKQNLTADSSQPKKYALDLRLKNVSAVDATEIKVTLQLLVGGKPVKTQTLALPFIIKAGAEDDYKLDVGALPAYDSYQTSMTYKELVPPPPPEAK
jgi:hypothetical protein